MFSVKSIKNQDTYAYAGFDNTTQHIVVAFRGTIGMDSTNWITNLKTDYDPYPNPIYPDAGVHSGFYKAYNGVKNQLIQAVQSLRDSYSNPSIMVFGHSMGGALALLSVMDLRRELGIPPENITFYTYGQPRVGGKSFRDYVYYMIGQRYFRVVHNDDMVPHLPSSTFNFRHAGIEVWYRSSGNYQICVNFPKKLENQGCSNSIEFPEGIDEHREYMGVPLSEMCN